MSRIDEIKLKKTRRGFLGMFPKWELDMPEWQLELPKEISDALEGSSADLKCDKVSFIFLKSNPPILVLKVQKGYPWGVTGWPWPPKGAVRAAMPHDALYGAMGCGVINRKKSRKVVDVLFYQHLKDVGVSGFLAAPAYAFVRWLGGLYGRKCEKC